MPVEVKHENGIMTAVISGEIDHHTARAIREAIDSAAERIKPEHMRLDFSGVSFMDSSGIGLIMGRYRLMQEMGGSLELLGASANIARMIKLAGLSRLGVKGV